MSRLAAIRVGHLEPKFQVKGSSLANIFFGFYKTTRILLSNGENGIVLRAVVLTQYRRVTDRRTDRRTDEIAVASTALAMRRAVKTKRVLAKHGTCALFCEV